MRRADAGGHRRARSATAAAPDLLARPWSHGRLHDLLPARARAREPASRGRRAPCQLRRPRAFTGGTPAHGLAVRIRGALLAPVAIAAADGGNGYWHRHGRDDPMRMLTDELIPLCRRAGLGRFPHAVGATGISMGGYGALLLAERHPALIAAVSAISGDLDRLPPGPRGQRLRVHLSAGLRDARRGRRRYPSAHRRRVAAGTADPFYPGVQGARQAPAGAVTHFSFGCHSGPFFAAQEPPSSAVPHDPPERLNAGEIHPPRPGHTDRAQGRQLDEAPAGKRSHPTGHTPLSPKAPGPCTQAAPPTPAPPTHVVRRGRRPGHFRPRRARQRGPAGLAPRCLRGAFRGPRGLESSRVI